MGEPTGAADRAAYNFRAPEGLLAHYTTTSAAFEHILPSGQLRLSPYRLMRDPTENKDILPAITWRGDPPDRDRALSSAYEHIKAARDRMRVLSLTRDAVDTGEARPAGAVYPEGVFSSGFDCCWSRPRMWEQYGDIHRGACLLFDRSRLERAIRNEWPDERTYIRNVDYTRKGIVDSAARHLVDERIFDDEQRARAVAEFIGANHGSVFFLKSDDFATEYEYRVVLAAGDDEYAYVGYGPSLVAVMLGERFPKWQRPGAIEACENAGVRLVRMHWEQGNPIALRVQS